MTVKNLNNPEVMKDVIIVELINGRRISARSFINRYADYLVTLIDGRSFSLPKTQVRRVIK